jgi:hypothetical protein
MSISTQSLPDACRGRTLRWQPAGYWLATGALAILAVLTVLSWALRPASRRTPPAAGPSRAR